LFVSLEQSLPAAYQIRLIPFAPTPDELDHFLFPKEAIDAALFAYPGDEHLPFIAEMARLHPVVVLGRKLDVPGAACVYTDNKNAAETAVLHLVSRGHTVIGMLSGPMEMTDSRERQEGYSQALRSSGIPLEESLIVYTSPLELNGFRAMLELFDRNTVRRITAVFAAGDLIAIGALSALESMGIRVPEELSVIGIDDIDEAARLRPPLTTMRIPIPELARNAAALVVSAVDQGTGKTVIEMPAVLVERESVGNRAAGAQTTQSRLSPRPRGNKT
jgi:LacI family transcriptional regulator